MMSSDRDTERDSTISRGRERRTDGTREIQRTSMRTDLEVLNFVDLIITRSIMQSDDENVSVSVEKRETEKEKAE